MDTYKHVMKFIYTFNLTSFNKRTHYVNMVWNKVIVIYKT